MEVVQPFVTQLAEHFRIVVVLFNYSTPPGLVELLSSWEKEGIIERYSLTPDHRNTLRFHLFMRAEIRTLRQYKFDLWLTGSEMQVGERYILECVLPKHCVSVCMWHNITFLFMHNQDTARRLLSGGNIREYPQAREGFILNGDSYLQRFKRKINQGVSFSRILEYIFLSIKTYVLRIRKKIQAFYDRIVLPWLLAGKTFRLGPYDKMTQLGSGRSDAIIFFDELESKVHKALFRNVDIYTARYPAQGNCRCHEHLTEKKTVLSMLSGFVGRNWISEEALSLFYRDFKTIITFTNAENIHLRLHPDETGKWPEQLRDYLVNKGIEAILADSKQPIRQIMCNYLGTAGFASASLRDARSSCDHAFVIGFVGISRKLFRDPKFVFANSEGIGWIEEDGGYDPDIFKRHNHVHPKRKTVPEILVALSNG